VSRGQIPQTLFGRFAALAVVSFICLSAAADPSDSTAQTSSSWFDSLKNVFGWSFDGQAYSYGEGLARTPKSVLNPGNSIVSLPNVTVTGELRPNAQVTSEFADLVLKPRLTSVYEGGGGLDEETLRGYLNEGYVRGKPTDEISVVAGRQLLTWGPAFFRSPSNPYYFDNARLDPIRELSGIDVTRLVYSPSSNWTLSGGYVFDSGHDLIANDAYRQSMMLKVDYRGVNYLGSLIIASLRHQQVFIGGYAQGTPNDAILLYGEFGSSSNKSGLDISPTDSVGDYTAGVDTGRQAMALLGGSYTFENGQSVYLEYLYNGFGYSAKGERKYFRQAGVANTQAMLGGGLGGLGLENLGYAATRADDLLGRHYVYVQFQNSQSDGGTLWRVMAAENLEDLSTQLSFYVEYNLAPRVSLFALGVANLGAHGSEFGALFRESLTAGLKIFVF